MPLLLLDVSARDVGCNLVRALVNVDRVFATGNVLQLYIRKNGLTLATDRGVERPLRRLIHDVACALMNMCGLRNAIGCVSDAQYDVEAVGLLRQDSSSVFTASALGRHLDRH